MATVDHVRERLRKLKDERGYTFAELDRMTDHAIGQSQLCRFLAGQNLANEKVNVIAEKLGIGIDDHDQQLLDQLTDIVSEEKSQRKRRRHLETLLATAKLLASLPDDELKKLTPERVIKNTKKGKAK